MNENELMGILDEFIAHYEELSKKAYARGDEKMLDYHEAMGLACLKLKKRIRTVFKNKSKNDNEKP